MAEQPEIHLRPHVDAWCERDQPLAMSGAYTDGRHAFVLDLEWRAAPASVGEARGAVFSLIGSFAEGATYVRQRRVAGDADGSPQDCSSRSAQVSWLPTPDSNLTATVVLINVKGVL